MRASLGFAFVWCAFVATAGTQVARGDTVTIGPSKDNTLFEDGTGSVSDGAGPYVRAGTAGASSQRRGVMAFDISGNIPAGATITSVQLELNIRQISAQWPGPTDVSLHRLNADWGEGTSDAGGVGSGAPSTTNDATWIHRFFNTTLWAAAGGDFVAAPSATATVPGVSLVTWGSTAGMVADVQAWLDTPASNFGWIVIGDEGQPRTAFYFDSRQNQDVPPVPPELTIGFTPPGPTAPNIECTVSPITTVNPNEVLLVDCFFQNDEVERSVRGYELVLDCCWEGKPGSTGSICHVVNPPTPCDGGPLHTPDPKCQFDGYSTDCTQVDCFVGDPGGCADNPAACEDDGTGGGTGVCLQQGTCEAASPFVDKLRPVVGGPNGYIFGADLTIIAIDFGTCGTTNSPPRIANGYIGAVGRSIACLTLSGAPARLTEISRHAAAVTGPST